MKNKTTKNPELIKLEQELKTLKNQKKTEENRNWEIFLEYYEMEGKYGHRVHGPWDCGMGNRGYHYEYPSDELREKEEKERKQFLIDNNYLSSSDIDKKYAPLIEDLKNRICILKNGRTLQEQQRFNRIKALKKDIQKYQDIIKTLQEEIKELEEN